MNAQDRHTRVVAILGWMATAAAVSMYLAYYSQIQLNLSGHKGSPLQPGAAAVNCLLWTAYGMMKRPRDWPIVAANIPGIILGSIAFITAL